MDSQNSDTRYIRAPSLKRGKNESGLNERVSCIFSHCFDLCCSLHIFRVVTKIIHRAKNNCSDFEHKLESNAFQAICKSIQLKRMQSM